MLLPLRDAGETMVLLRALVYFADYLEENGDALQDASLVDAIAARVRNLDALASVNAREWVRSLDLPSNRGRRQG